MFLLSKQKINILELEDRVPAIETKVEDESVGMNEAGMYLYVCMKICKYECFSVFLYV